jgi:hypothetical protein
MADYQAKVKNAALEAAKLQWAEALLDAPEAVAQILAQVAPNASDPGSFIQTVLSCLPAAKATGNFGTIKALVYALRAAVAKGDGAAESLYSLIAGDPLITAPEQTNMEMANAPWYQAVVDSKNAASDAAQTGIEGEIGRATGRERGR